MNLTLDQETGTIGNGSVLGGISENTSCCPVHGGRIKKEYGYGRFAKAPVPNASITVYQGCKCAVVTVGTSLKKTYFDNWSDADSEARFQCQRLDRWG